MPLTHRKPRALSRDKQICRDDKLIIIACDDTYAPKQYSGFVRFPRVHVHVIETTKRLMVPRRLRPCWSACLAMTSTMATNAGCFSIQTATFRAHTLLPS